MSCLSNAHLRPMFLLKFGPPLSSHPALPHTFTGRERFAFWYYHRGFQKHSIEGRREITPDYPLKVTDFLDTWQAYVSWHRAYYIWWRHQVIKQNKQ